MKSLLVLVLFLGTSVSFAEDHFMLEAEETDASVLSPEEEEAYLEEQALRGEKGRFPQTRWLECSDAVTGNYTGFNCTNRRGISVVLDGFLQDNFLRCANAGLSAIGSQRAVDMHVTHAGIQGDANHSPRSLHAEARAVDVRSFTMYFSNGSSREFLFRGSSNITFFNAFRSCWGRTIANQNGCPLISGQTRLTASIGKEDSNHQNHMHVSVPHCVNGNYSGLYFRR